MKWQPRLLLVPAIPRRSVGVIFLVTTDVALVVEMAAVSVKKKKNNNQTCNVKKGHLKVIRRDTLLLRVKGRTWNGSRDSSRGNKT